MNLSVEDLVIKYEGRKKKDDFIENLYLENKETVIKYLREIRV